MRNSGLKWWLLIAVAALAGVGWIAVSRDSTAATNPISLATAPHVGNLAPDFTLTDAAGNSYTLSRYTAGGQPVVLNFWATWCPPCRIEMPHFERLSAEYDGRVAVLGINQAESADAIAEYAAGNGLTYPLLADREMKVNNLFGVLNLPTTIFIDKNGVVREVLVGTISQAVLEDRIEKLLDS